MTMYATKTYGFTPSEWPLVAFSMPGWREKLLKVCAPVDTMLIVATNTSHTPPEQRGRVLGYFEFAAIPMPTGDLADLDHLGQTDTKKIKAVPALRAWRISEPPLFKKLLPDTAGRRRAANMRAGFETLSEDEEKIVRALAVTEEPIELSPAVIRAAKEAGLLNRLQKRRGPAPGRDTSFTVERHAGGAATYLLRWPSQGIMKVGRSSDPTSRAMDLSQSLVPELTGEKWQVVATEDWPDEQRAHLMEQAFIDALDREGIRRSGEYFLAGIESKIIEDRLWSEAMIEAQETYRRRGRAA